MLFAGFGSERFHDKSLPLIQRLYIRIFGAPEIGAKIRWNIVKRIIQMIPFSSCFDAGCGNAYMLFYLSKKQPDHRFMGYDLSKADITRNSATAEIMRLQNLEFVQGDILDINIKDKFDLVVSVDNLEHIQDDVQALRQLATVMRPDSTLLIHVPKPEKEFFFKSSHDYFLEDHARDGYTTAELADKLGQAGFTVTSSTEHYNFFQTFANELGTKAAGILPLYALLLPFTYLISLVPDFIADRVKPVRNSIVVIARLK